MNKQSNVGDRRVYEAGDQRNISRKDQKQQKAEQRYDEGNKNAHSVMDSKDERTIANRLAAAESANKSSHNASGETSDDPRNAALLHGNEPSRGAKIDAELKADDEAILAKKAGKTDSLPGKKL